MGGEVMVVTRQEKNRRQEMFNKLVEVTKELGRAPRFDEVEKDERLPNPNDYAYYFGSYTEAARQAEVRAGVWKPVGVSKMVRRPVSTDATTVSSSSASQSSSANQILSASQISSQKPKQEETTEDLSEGGNTMSVTSEKKSKLDLEVTKEPEETKTDRSEPESDTSVDQVSKDIVPEKEVPMSETSVREVAEEAPKKRRGGRKPGVKAEKAQKQKPAKTETSDTVEATLLAKKEEPQEVQTSVMDGGQEIRLLQLQLTIALKVEGPNGPIKLV